MKQSCDAAPLRAAIRGALRHASAAIAGSLLINAPPLLAQTSGATLRGQVTGDAQPRPGVRVTVTNEATGLTRSTVSDVRGSYSLPGLPPGTYRVEAQGEGVSATRSAVLQVGQTATLDLGTGQAETDLPVERELETATVTATRLFEMRTSEIGTVLTPGQIEALPQNSRNFLAFADIVPGVQFVTSGDGSSSELRSGAQAANGVNVFIDGVGQKNYVMRGGVSGQAQSRGNPFPQLAIGEYKVITSNYKAEFDQLSSAAVVAATRSGTNEFEIEGFWDRTAENWREADPFEKEAGEKAASEQEQYGIAIGGPILRDRMHFFLAYEAKQFQTPKTVTLGQGLAPADVGDFAQYLGVKSTPFDEDLFFGKLDWSPGTEHLLELTARLRRESEIEGIGGQNTPEFASSKDNDELRIDLRHQYSAAGFQNDLHLTWEDAEFNPRPVTFAPGYRLTRIDQTRILLNLGGGENYQERGQKGWGVQNDVTITPFQWHGQHTVKAGFKYKHIEVNSFEQQPYNPQFFYDIDNDLATPYRVEFGALLPGFPPNNVVSRNRQFGIYVQDDWEVNERLLLNLGLRWDHEETPTYLQYVTPPDVIAGLHAIDPAAEAAGRAGQTYAQTLALGGVDVNDYISNGRNRHSFTGALQPRLGFSWDLTGDERHVLFGGAGRAYDRNVFNYLALEQSKGTFPRYVRTFDVPGHSCVVGEGDCVAWDPAYLQDRQALAAMIATNPQLGREINLLHNNLKTPYSDQYSLGVRNRLGSGSNTWNSSLALSYVESKDGIVFLLANRYPDGSFRPEGTTWGNQPWGNGIPGLGSLLVGKNGLETRARSLLAQLERPYTRGSGWGATFAYTFTLAKENRTNSASADEHYLFDYAEVGDFGWHRSTGLPRHRLVATGIWEAPWRLTLSAKLTLQTPVDVEAVNCFDAADNDHCFFDNFRSGKTLGQRQLDLALQKEWQAWGGASLRVRADVLNVFDWNNADTYDVWRGDPGSANAAFGEVTGYRQPTRTFKLSLALGWR